MAVLCSLVRTRTPNAFLWGRSTCYFAKSVFIIIIKHEAGVAELADAQALGACALHRACGFKSRLRHWPAANLECYLQEPDPARGVFYYSAERHKESSWTV